MSTNKHESNRSRSKGDGANRSEHPTTLRARLVGRFDGTAAAPGRIQPKAIEFPDGPALPFQTAAEGGRGPRDDPDSTVRADDQRLAESR